jgi:release factor glutamine methyltransferase
MERTIAATIAAGADQLRAASFETPRLDAEILARHVLGIDRTHLFVRLRDSFPSERAHELDILIEQRLSGAPIAYLTGGREFMGMTFHVGPGVLVPRPETELVVERALDWLKDRDGAKVLDVGTGSGAIAISIAKLCPTADVIAGDVSAQALRWAARNRNDLNAPVKLVQGNLTEPFAGPVDLLHANLPYLRPEQFANNRELSAEPELALVSGTDGLSLIRRLIADAPRVMANNGAIALEIDPSQNGAVEALARDRFPGAIITTRDDLAGLARHVWIYVS